MHAVSAYRGPSQEPVESTHSVIPNMLRTHFSTTDSTQTQAKLHIESLEPKNWLLFTADEQTQGRGQYDRRWASPPHVNVYATYVFALPSDRQRVLPHITQVATLAVAKTIEEFGFHPEIKWINDLLLNGKKMCGILCEATSLSKTHDFLAVLCGIGINVNMAQEICESLDQPVTSLMVEAGRTYDKEAILLRLSHHLHDSINRLINHGFESFLTELNQRLAFLNQRITIEDSLPGTTRTEGIFRGVNELGHMILQKDTGEEITICTGRIVR